MSYIEEYKRLRDKIRKTLAKDPSKMEELAQDIGICVETLGRFNVGNESVRRHTLLKIEDYYKRIEKDE